MKRAIVGAVAAMTASAALLAQPVPPPTFPGVSQRVAGVPQGIPDLPAGVPGVRQNHQQQMTAPSFGARPGDEHLSCAAIENEITALVNDPELIGYSEGAAARAERFVSADASPADLPSAFAARVASAGQFVAAIPGTTQAQAAEALNRQELAFEAAMPKLARYGHIVQLGVMKGCDVISAAGGERGLDGPAGFDELAGFDAADSADDSSSR